MSGFSFVPNRPMFVLYQLIGADMNTTADQAFVKLHNYAAYTIQNIRATNASISLTTAAGGLYTGAAKSGITLIAASQNYTAGTTSAKGFNLTNTNDTIGRLTADPILSLTTPQGAAATLDLYVYGFGVA